MVMVTKSFGCRPSPWDWSNLFQKEIIFGKKFMILDWGPLHGNGRRILWM